MLPNELVISAVPAHMIDIVWPLVDQYVEMAVAYSNEEMELEDIKGKLKAVEMVMLTVTLEEKILACFTVERRDFPTGKSILHIATAGGGEIDLWLDKMLEVLNNLAKEQGCDELYIIGRPGWQRVLKDKRFKPVHTVLCQTVEN